MLEERRLQKAKISLMRSERFALFSGILMVGRTTVDDDTKTASTNGRDEKYGRDFVKKLKDNELAFLVMHEGMHKAYRHLSTWKKLHDENHSLANCACDYVINLQLKDIDPEERIIAMPRYKDGEKKGEYMGLIDEKYRGLNAKQVFDLLKEEYGGEGGGEGVGDEDGNGGLDEHDWNGAKELTKEEKEKLAKEIDQAMRQGLMAHQKIAGKGKGGLDRNFEALLAPKVDWREVLREFVKATCRAKDASSWRRVNRRYLSTGVYMPSLIGEKVGHLVVAIDTSGSIGGDELNNFLSEVKGIAEEVNPEKVDLLYWGHEVESHEEYDGATVANIVSSTKPVGGGGTAPSCISQYLKDKKIEPECIIVLTDGYVGDDWGSDWTAPLMWVIVGGNKEMAAHGKTIHVED
jgi:predicted metal-dependent peptidase